MAFPYYRHFEQRRRIQNQHRKQIVLIYTNNKHRLKDIRKAISFTVAPEITQQYT